METITIEWPPGDLGLWKVSPDCKESYTDEATIRRSSSTLSSLKYCDSIWSLRSLSSASVPTLVSDDDDSIVTVPSTKVPLKLRKYRSTSQLSFVDCTNDHPLKESSTDLCTSMSRVSIHGGLRRSVPAGSPYPKGGRRAPHTACETRTAEDTNAVLGAATTAFPETESEMTLYDTRKQILIRRPRKRNFRVNSEFLRMYAGERRLLLNRKIPAIPTRPVLPPRMDYNTPDVTDKLLGITCGWQKVKPKRVWSSLSAEDFGE